MSAPLPDTASLTDGLASILGSSVTIVERRCNPEVGRSPSEIVSCRAGDATVELFCKYENGRSTATYEAMVYRDVVEPSGIEAPRLIGTHVDETGRAWLVLEHLGELPSLDRIDDFASMTAAARWLGQMHTACEPQPCLRDIPPEYYVDLAREGVSAAERSGDAPPWLAPLAARFEELAPDLLAVDRTVSHGDFYGHNILFRNGAVLVIDWEEASVDAGELDLACLTDGLSSRYWGGCELAYVRARWPDGDPPADFAKRLEVARLALFFFSIRNREWLEGDKYHRYLMKLHRTGVELGLLEPTS